MQTKILLIEDDPDLGKLIEVVFSRYEFDVTWFTLGKPGLDAFMNGKFDLCVLDLTLPDMSGFEVISKLKIVNPKIPCLFITGRSDLGDKFRAFELGCDDYICKPFAIQELILRAKAILKRSVPEANDEYKSTYIGEYEFNYEGRLLAHKGQNIKISNKEADIIKLFLEHKNSIINKNDMLLRIWGVSDPNTTRNLDVYLNKLRKIFSLDENIRIVNIHGVGYKMVETYREPSRSN